MSRALVLLLAATPLLAAPAAKDKEPVLYYPVKVGATLVYQAEFAGRSFEVTDTVTKVGEKDGIYRVTTEQKQAGEQAGETVVEVSAAGLTQALVAEGDVTN